MSAWLSAALEALATGSVLTAMVGASVLARRVWLHPEMGR